MPPFDWSVTDRIRQVKKAYRAAGAPLSLVQQFLMPVNFGTVAGGARFSPAPLVVPQEADFLWLGNMMAPHPNQSQTGPAGFGLLMKILLTGPNRYLGRHREVVGEKSGTWVSPMSIAGRARMPFLWPYPILLRGGEQVAFDVVNQGSASVTNLRFTLLGLKLEPRGRTAASRHAVSRHAAGAAT